MAKSNDQSGEMKDFIAFKSGASFQIKPQTPRGWWLGLIWTLALLAPTVPLILLAWSVDETPREIWVFYAVVPHLLLTGLIGWMMMRWMIARAEIVRRDEKGNWVSDRDAASRRDRR